MRAEKGRGMSVEQVNNFINGCESHYIEISAQAESNATADYPAYELYTDVLRHGIFASEKGKQLRLVVCKDRRVKEVHRI